MSRYFNFFGGLGRNATPSSPPLASPPRTPLSNITARTSGSNVSSLTNSENNNNRTSALLTLAEVANASTNQTMNPVDEEEEYDTRCYNECAGASDSEDEGGVDGETSLFVSNGHDSDDDAAITEPVAMVSDPDNPNAQHLWGAPPGWKPPGPDDEWKAKDAKTERGEPKFEDVDNPGGWSQYVFQSKFDKGKGKYKHHCLPTGCTPVPADEDGKREVGGYEFHYKGWKKEGATFRSGADREDMFPKERGGSLCDDTLQKLGMDAGRMQESDGAPDCLFFEQLLFPICDPSKSGVSQDPRTPYHSTVARCTNSYALNELSLGIGYGHRWQMAETPEIVHWDGTAHLDGALGGSHGAILRRFDTRPGNKMFDKDIAKAFTKTRWLQIKRCMKLQNNLTSKKRGEEGYDPAYKCDLVFKCLVNNVNAVTKRACLDACGDETTFAHNGYGEAGSDLVKLVKGKPGVTRGMQTVLLMDTDWLRPRAHVHRHKLHDSPFSLGGPAEARMLCEQLEPMIVTGIEEAENTNKPRGIYSEKPHLTFDNYFSGDCIVQYACEKGFGLTMTVRRDRLPKGIPTKYLQKEKTPVSRRSKAARFENPVFITRECEGSIIQLTSFQSTSSCNILSVNALNDCELYCHTKQRGRGDKKRQWGIEMNQSRELYLRTYGGVDRLDHLLKNCHIHYR